MTKRKRPIQELAARLDEHVRLLKEYAAKADGDEAYLGELAGKLRVLVYESPTNVPLLLRMMEELGIEVEITLDGPPIKRFGTEPNAGGRVSLRTYLGLMAYGIRVPSNEFVTVSKLELIAMWAQQTGASHEDWELDERLAAARDSRLWIGKDPALKRELKVTAETVLHVAEQVLTHPNFIAARKH